MSMSDDQKELFAKILSWAIIIAIVFIIVMIIFFLVNEVALVSVGGTGLVGIFYLVWAYSNGLFFLILGALIMGLFSLVLVFSLLIKSGQRIFLKLIFKVEEVSVPAHVKPRSKKKGEDDSE